MRRVILGPESEFHSGIHGQLVATPPAGITYLLPDHRHRYLMPDGGGDPFTGFSLSETVEFALPADRRIIAHTSRVPVFNRIPWVVDADCLLATLSYGTAFIIGTGAEVPIDAELGRLRQRVMLSHYLSDRCVGILFQTDHARKKLLRYVEARSLLSSMGLTRLAERCDVVRPAMPSAAARSPGGTFTVVYMGRSSEDKGADVALEVFRRLSARYRERVRVVFVGPPPEANAVPPGVCCHPLLAREDYLALLRDADVFLSPTDFESLGFGLLEAASHGMALVTSRGPGMEHIEELFAEETNALFVPTTATFADKAKLYEYHLRTLIEDPSRLRAMQRRNAEMFRAGEFSLEVQHRKLNEYYDRAFAKLDRSTSQDDAQAPAAFDAPCRLSNVVLDAAAWQRRRAEHRRNRVLVR